MAKKKLTATVEELFREVGKAHRDAFRDKGGTDPEWPLWYADHLHQDLVKVLDPELTQSRLVYLLVQGERKRSKKKPKKGDWPKYYARYLVKRLS
jgi:hypothetical protein